jgi:hypothetical protein
VRQADRRQGRELLERGFVIGRLVGKRAQQDVRRGRWSHRLPVAD